MSLVTIVIVAHNESTRIDSCLQHVLNQDLSSSQYKVVLVDNASTDNTIERALKVLRSQDRIPWQLLRNPENNMGSARALGVQESTTPWIAFLDADCEPHAGWLRQSLTAIDQLSLSGHLGGLSLPLEYKAGSGWVAFARSALSQVRVAVLGSPQASSFNTRRAVDHIPTACAVFNRQAVLASGNFSEDFPRVCEDVELCIRLRKNGFRIWRVPGEAVLHNQQDSLDSWLKRMWRYGSGQPSAWGASPLRWPRRLIPVALFLPLWIALTWLGWQALVVGLAIYFLFFFGIYKRTHKASSALKITLFAGLTHLTYASGFVVGWCKKVSRSISLRLRGYLGDAPAPTAKELPNV